MSGFAPPADGHAGDLVSAHLDGELDAAAVTWVDDHLAVCPACRRQADDAASARAWVRSLPAVDSSPVVGPFLARRRTAVRVGSAFVAASTVVLAVVALSAAVLRTDVVPDVEGAIATHVSVGGVVGDEKPVAGRPVATSAAGAGVLDVITEPGLATRVSSVGGPYQSPPALIGNRVSLSRQAIYDGDDLAVVVYGDGDTAVSIFEQPGRLRWDSLPEGRVTSMGSRRVWHGERAEGPEVMVTQAGDLVIMVVSEDEGAARTAVDGLPDGDRGSAWHHVHDACSRFAEVFALGG